MDFQPWKNNRSDMTSVTPNADMATLRLKHMDY